MKEHLIVIGGGEHARVVMDAALSRPDVWNLLGFLDPRPCKETITRLAVDHLGTDADASATARRFPDAAFVIGVGAPRDAERRAGIAQRFSDTGVRWATVIHRDATISPHAVLGHGTVVFARAVVNTGARIGAHCVVNTGGIVEHDVTLGDFTQIAPGATLGGGAQVGSGTYVGLGSRVRDHVRIGDGALVAMGAVVVDDVPDGVEVIGVPARPRAHD